jgi:hypothetical protein
MAAGWQHAESAGLTCQKVQATTIELAQGRSRQVLRPADAMALYRRMHKTLVVVFTAAGTAVRTRPHERPGEGTLLPLANFVRYKASHAVLTRIESLPADCDRAIASVDDLDWDELRDPRLLPLHCFKQLCEADLDTADGVGAFRRAHRKRRPGGGWCWCDGTEHVWEPASIFHALDDLTIGAKQLPNGFHWDVNVSRDTEFSNGWEVWSVKRGSYINVHPNAHIRSTRASRIWDPAKEEGKRLRTPSEARKRAGRRLH